MELCDEYKRQTEESVSKFTKWFSFEELVRLFASIGYELDNKGKSSGSRVAFINKDAIFTMHTPHPGNLVKKGTLKMVNYNN